MLFLAVVGLGYGVDLAPRYLALFRGDFLQIQGPATQFRRDCQTSETVEARCTDAYVIPRSVIGDAEAVGLGMFVSATEIYCTESPDRTVVFGGRRDPSRVLELLKTYQTVDLNGIGCRGDVVVEAWGPRAYGRSGYVGGTIVVGTATAVAQVKRLVEFFAGQLHLLLALALLACLLLRLQVLRPLVRTGEIRGPFSENLVPWSAFAWVKGGITELVLPMVGGPFTYVRIANFVSEIAHYSPALTVSLGNKVPRRVWLSVAAVVFGAFALSPWFGKALAPLTAVCVGLSAWTAVRTRSTAMGLFAVACAIEGLKVFNVRGLPYGSTTLMYASFLIFGDVLGGIRKGARTAELLHWIRALRTCETKDELQALLQDFEREFGLEGVSVESADEEADAGAPAGVAIRQDGVEIGRLRYRRASESRYADEEIEMAAQRVASATAQVLWAEQLREAASRAERAAHDIRAPLAALRVASESLAKVSLDAGTQSLMTAATARIGSIAEAILRGHESAAGASESASGTTTLVREETEAIVSEFRGRLAAEGGRRIELELPREVLVAVAEPSGFQRVLSNWITNAVEATAAPKGVIQVRVRNESEKIVVEVSDDGNGIPAEILARVGKEKITFGKPGGTGLGLLLSKELVESWGGTFEVESSGGKGTTVRMCLRDRNSPSRHFYDAVLIDDDEIVRKAWELSADSGGKRIRVFESVEAFWKSESTLAFKSPVYVDRYLGDGHDGVEIAKRIRAVGFERLFLASGSRRAVSAPDWLESASKLPPWQFNSPSHGKAES